MFIKQFWVGFLVATVLMVGLSVWAIVKLETDIMFPTKTFFAGKDYAAFSGSVVGEGRVTMNGTMTGECYRKDGICQIYTIDQIGHNQVGQIYSDTATIRQWDDKILMADTKGNNPDQCNYYEIRVYLPTEDISYTRFPQKKDGDCANYEAKVVNWKIDDSYAWQKLTKDNK